jgi:hypothetical protein
VNTSLGICSLGIEELMDVRIKIAIGTVVAVIIGWVFNAYMNRRHEIFKRRMDLRFELYESCIAVAMLLAKMFQSTNLGDDARIFLTSDFTEKLEQCQVYVLLYGTKFEIDKINEIVKLAKINSHTLLQKEFAELMWTIRDSVRKDLRLPKLTH